MVIFANKKSISSVVVSSALGHSGRGILAYKLTSPGYRELLKLIEELKISVISKTATRFRLVGNVRKLAPWTYFRYIKKLPDGTIVNAYGLSNDGVLKHAQEIGKSHSLGFNVIPSFYPEFSKGESIVLKETIEATEIYQKYIPNFWIIELNLSCPNANDDITKNTEQRAKLIYQLKKEFPWLIIIAKGSILHSWEFYQELEKAKVDALHTINSIPFHVVYPNKKSPLYKGTPGALSGGDILQRSLRFNNTLRQKVKLPIIMGGGITKSNQIEFFMKIGANCVSFCSLAVLDPRMAIKTIEKL